MYTTEHTADTSATPDQIWSALRDLHTGTALSDRSDRFEIHGPFAVGTTLTVTPQGQDSFESVIVELVEDRRYADRTDYNGITLLFRHTLVPIAGGTRVTHQLEIDGPGADEIATELGPQISGDFPDAMDELFAAALLRPSRARR